MKPQQPTSTCFTWREHRGPMMAERHGGTVIDCALCGFKHTVPLPDDTQNRQLYTAEFYDELHPDYIERQRRDLPWRQLEFAAKYKVFEDHLPPHRRRLLDVGSGPGWFLQHGSERGWNVVGIEPSEAAGTFSREELGLDVVTGFFEPESAAGLEPFDVVHLNNVLEHVPDPAGVLATARSVMLPGGLICISVPNDFNPLQEILVNQRGHEQWWVNPGEHLNYFDCASLCSLLVRGGFVVKHQTGSFPLELFALMGEDYLTDASLGPVIHGRRKALEMALAAAGKEDLLAEVYTRLMQMNLGRIVTVVGELPVLR